MRSCLLVSLLVPLAVPLAACKSAPTETSSAVEKAAPAASSSAPAASSSGSTASAAAVAGDELSRYRADLTSRDKPTDNIQENVALRLGPWRFFCLRSVAQPVEPAAVTAGGAIVSMAHRDDWFKLLSAKASTREIADRYAWLLGGAVVISDGKSLTDPQAQTVIKPPELKTDGDGTLHVTMFVVRPPNTQDPSRLHIGSPPVGRGYFDDAGWRNVLGQ